MISSISELELIVIEWFKVVDDDSAPLRKSVCNIIKNYVETCFQPIECEDGIDILKVIKDDFNEDIKIIITDENMEYMSGSRTISILKNLERNNKIAKYFIVSLTAFSDEQTIKEIKDKGANMVIEKPLTNNDFENLVNCYKEAHQINKS